MSGKRILLVGEGMVELTVSPGRPVQLGYGGDTLNTAIHLARLGGDVSYFSALGADDFSTTLRTKWEAEGLSGDFLLTDPERNVGLYAIQCDDQGERSFTYWRGDSAARQMFALPSSREALARARGFDLLAFSLVTLAILPEEGRKELLKLASDVREHGGIVAFDGNYRPRLWQDREEALRWRDAALGVSDIGLPTLEDETQLCLTREAAAVQEQWSALGCGEVVVKLGPEGCLLPGGEVLPPTRVVRPVDTSGAGDAFNAGYLDARLRGDGFQAAARRGHDLACWTILQPGAIPARPARPAGSYPPQDYRS